jgi:hypothetical protein
MLQSCSACKRELEKAPHGSFLLETTSKATSSCLQAARRTWDDIAGYKNPWGAATCAVLDDNPHSQIWQSRLSGIGGAEGAGGRNRLMSLMREIPPEWHESNIAVYGGVEKKINQLEHGGTMEHKGRTILSPL